MPQLYNMKILFLLQLVCCFYAASANTAPAEKILLVRVTEIGIITVNNDTVSSDFLARYIQERLFKSYAGTGKMYRSIKFEKASPNVPEMVTAVVLKEIKSGQNGALVELTLQKYKKLFENLETHKQEKLRKNFPVLFQTSFSGLTEIE